MFGYFPSTASLDEGLLMYDCKTSTNLYDEGHLHYFTYRSLKRILLERVGMSEVRIHGYGKPILLTKFSPKLISDCIVIGIK